MTQSVANDNPSFQINNSIELQGGKNCLEDNERAVRMVLAMIIAFFICWLPYTVISVVVVVNPEIYIPPLVATMPMYFAKTSPVYNPIIYFLTNKQVCLMCLHLLSQSLLIFIYIMVGLVCAMKPPSHSLKNVCPVPRVLSGDPVLWSIHLS